MKDQLICISRKIVVLIGLLCLLSLFLIYVSESIRRERATSQTQAAPRAIIGGRAASQGEFPYMVLLYYKDKAVLNSEKGEFDFYTKKSLLCGGVVLYDSWIVTAAHCFEGIKEYSNIGLAVGLTGLIGKMDPEIYRNTLYSISDVYIHPDYPGGFDYAPVDVAIIKTNKSIISSFQKPILAPIHLENELYALDNQVTVAGYGVYRFDTIWIFPILPVYPKELQTIKLPIVSGPNKNPLRIGYLDEKKANKNSTHKGDSGSPIIYEHNGIKYLIGIASHNLGPVYSPKLSSHLDWITSITGKK